MPVRNHRKLLDPWLQSVKEKFSEARDYIEGSRVSRGIVVKLLFDAVITTFQRMIIDRKGFNVLEQLRKGKKLYFNSLISILRKDGVEIENITELDILRDLRNRIEHEGYRPTEQDVKWAYQTAQAFIMKYYPEVFQILEEIKPSRTPLLEKKTLSIPDLFRNFTGMKNFEAGEGIIEESVDTWMAERKRAKTRYCEMFKLENIGMMTENDFTSFLYFRNNRAWTMLYRQGLQLTKGMDKLRRTIAHLQDESIDIAIRIRDVLRGGDLHIRGFGKNIATGILHICDKEDRYGVWNNRTEEGLKRINKKPRISQDFGLCYIRINNELLKLKNELHTDLEMIDGFIWYLSKFYQKE